MDTNESPVTLVDARSNELSAWLAAIVDSSDDAIVSNALEGVVTSWNRGAERLFGYSAAEAVGQHISLIIPEDRKAEEDDVLARLRRGANRPLRDRQASQGRPPRAYFADRVTGQGRQRNRNRRVESGAQHHRAHTCGRGAEACARGTGGTRPCTHGRAVERKRVSSGGDGRAATCRTRAHSIVNSSRPRPGGRAQTNCARAARSTGTAVDRPPPDVRDTQSAVRRTKRPPRSDRNVGGTRAPTRRRRRVSCLGTEADGARESRRTGGVDELRAPLVDTLRHPRATAHGPIDRRAPDVRGRDDDVSPRAGSSEQCREARASGPCGRRARTQRRTCVAHHRGQRRWIRCI